MTFRKRIFITTALLCHLFLAPAWLISQLPPVQAAGGSAEPDAPAPNPAPTPVVPRATEPITWKAEKQEKQGDLYKLTGNAEVDFRDYVLKADEMTYNDLTGIATATGHVALDGGPHDEHITASNGTYDINTDSGKFFNVVGSTGAKLRGRAVVLTSSNPFLFTGKEVEKQGRDKIIVRHGRVTSCKLPKPKWTFNAGEIVVVAGESAKIYHSTFHLFGLPVFYFPFVEHPVERLPRQSGFLIPHIGNSTTKGFILGEGFYWAINRSADATLGLEYYSRRGWAQRGEFRARPSESSFINFNYFGVMDRGVPTTTTQFVPGVGPVVLPAKQDQGGEEAQLSAEAQLPYGFRGVATIDYLSQFVFRAVFAERFNEAINSETKSTAFVTKNQDGYSFNVMASRYQNFQSTSSGDVITIVHAPGGEVGSADRQLGRSPVYWSFDTAVEALSRREPQFVTGNAVGRFDMVPNVSMPLHWKGWNFRPELDLHETYYTERLLSAPVGIGIPVSDPVNRRAIEATVDIHPPALARVFESNVFHHKIKHVIEPRFKYRIVSGVDNFQKIIRFDYRDVLSDTNEMEYGIVQRLYIKQAPKPGCEGTAQTTSEGEAAAVKPGCEAPAAREAISWEVAQKYFFDPNFGGALIPGRRNVFTTTVDFTGISFLTEARRFSPIVSRLRFNTGWKVDAEWKLDYDTLKSRINSSTALVTYRISPLVAFSAGHAFLQTPGEVLVSNSILGPTKFNQFRLQLNFGNPNRRGVNAAAVAGYDAVESVMQYSAVQTTYNWDCCGITFEYRRFNLGNVRDESQYRFALTLANIGTFGTLRKQERLF